MTTNQTLRDALQAVRNSLQFINDTPGGAITDTLWMMDQPETVFDHIDAALATADADQAGDFAAALEVAYPYPNTLHGSIIQRATVPAPGSTGDDAELVALLDGYARDGTRGYQHYLEQIKARAARQPVAAAPAAPIVATPTASEMIRTIRAAEHAKPEPVERPRDNEPEPVGLCAPFPGMGTEWTPEAEAKLNAVLAEYPPEPKPVERQPIIGQGDGKACAAALSEWMVRDNPELVEQAKLVEGSREAFESALPSPQSECVINWLARNIDGDYVYTETRGAWQGWQLRGQQAGAVDGTPADSAAFDIAITISEQNQGLTADSAAERDAACTWRLADEEAAMWESSCGEAWTFIEGGPEENRVRFCHGCGNPVALHTNTGEKT